VVKTVMYLGIQQEFAVMMQKEAQVNSKNKWHLIF